MTVQTIAITVNLYDGTGVPITAGSAVFTPTSPVTSGLQEFVAVPVTVPLGPSGLPVAHLIPTDAPGSQPPNWAWQVAFPGLPGTQPSSTFQAPAGPVAFTAASGTPGVLTWTAAGLFTALPNGTGVQLTGGSLPAGVTAGTTYYVTGVTSSSGLAVQLAATPAGTPIALTSSGSGTLTVVSYYLSALAVLASSIGYAPYLTAPAGAPLAGQVPIASGDGVHTAWGQVMVPAQSFTLANNTYQPLHEWTVTGQTDSPLPSFGLVAGSQTYSWHTGGETTQGPAAWYGYNPRHLSGMSSTSTHGAIGMSFFADAGDTWNPATGGHGLEFCPGAFVSADASVATNVIQIVACDDNTNTVTLALRCGSGQFTAHDGTPYNSGITMTDAANRSYLTAGPYSNAAYGSVSAGTQPGVAINQPLSLGNLPYLLGTSAGAMTALFTSAGAPGGGAATWGFYSNNDSVGVTWQGGTSATHTLYAAGGAVLTQATSATGIATSTVAANGAGSTAAFKATSASGTAQLLLNGNTTASSQLVFQKSGVNTWVMQDSAASSLYLTNNSGNVQMLMTSGNNTAGNYNSAATYLLSKTLVYGALVVNNGGGALATSATDGFLYLPVCAGAPTGTPVANTGSAALVYDTTNNQLCVYRGGAWHAIGI